MTGNHIQYQKEINKIESENRFIYIIFISYNVFTINYHLRVFPM